MQEKGIPERRTTFLETCFDTFCKSGLENTSLQMLAEACGVTNGALLYYFGSKDNIIIESTAHCMAKVEDDFMAQAPTSFADIERFLREMPYLTAKLPRGKIPLYVSGICKSKVPGMRQGIFQRRKYKVSQLCRTAFRQTGMPADFIQGMTYLFVRACVHFALFEDEDYLQLQLNAIRTSLRTFMSAGKLNEEETL